jgi:hypothetical protein
MGADPQGIATGRARVGPVCAGRVNRGEWNNCAGKAEFAVVTTNGARLVVLGVCERHVLGAKWWVAENVSDTGEVLITTPEALEETLGDDEQILQVVPRAVG